MLNTEFVVFSDVNSKSSAGHRSYRCLVGKYDDQKSQISDQGPSGSMNKFGNRLKGHQID